MTSPSIRLMDLLVEEAYHDLTRSREDHGDDNDLLHRLDDNQSIHRMHNYQLLDISTLDDVVSVILFRFTYNDICRIIDVLGYGETISFRVRTEQAFHLDSRLSLAIMLRRLAYPSRLVDLQMLFDLRYTTICTVFNEMIITLYDRFHNSMKLNKQHLNPMNLELFSRAIADAGSPFRHIVGFIDGTVCTICRPIIYQRNTYHGHIRQHGLKYQGIVTPDGIIVSLDGPYIGRKHEKVMYNESGVESQLQALFDHRSSTGTYYSIYGDCAYVNSLALIAAKKPSSYVDADERDLYLRMASVRVAVEWEFGHVGTLFSFLKFKQQQRLMLSRVAKFYFIGTLMKNIHTCINRRNQTSDYFGVLPPTLEHFIEGLDNE